MSEIFNHFIDNLPSIALLLIAMLAGWAIKEIFLKKTALTEFKAELKNEVEEAIESIKQELKEKVSSLQTQINSAKDTQSKLHVDFTELKTDIKHITKMLEHLQKELNSSVFKRK